MSETTLLIPKIESGIVIDHIPAGKGLEVLEIVHSYPEMRQVVATVGLNYASQKLGRKDMLKLQTHSLPGRVMEHMAMVCAGVSIKRIENYKVVERLVVAVPDNIRGLARCRNPNCITNHERDVQSRFRCIDPTSKRFACAFCEGIFGLHELSVIVPVGEHLSARE